MRTVDEQLNSVLERAGAVRRKAAQRRAALQSGALMCLSFFLIGMLAFFAQSVSGTAAVPETAGFGSLISANPYLQYFAVGIISFLLGIAFTALCILLRQRARRGGDRK